MLNTNSLQMVPTPTRYCLTAGTSEGFSKLNAFDGAQLAAKVGNTNLVRMSSILPPKCQQETEIELPYGALVPIAYASMVSSDNKQTISSAVAIALPEDENLPGVIMEYSAYNTQDVVEAHVRKMAQQALEMRDWKIKEIQSISTECTVNETGATFAAVVLWY